MAHCATRAGSDEQPVSSLLYAVSFFAGFELLSESVGAPVCARVGRAAGRDFHRPLSAACNMVFRATDAVDDLRPCVTSRSCGERVNDSARRPEPRAAKRSTEKSGHLATSRCSVASAIDL